MKNGKYGGELKAHKAKEVREKLMEKIEGADRNT